MKEPTRAVARVGSKSEMPQNSVDFPAAWSRRASSASASSFPVFASRSIWRSLAAASNSANHCRKSASSSAERAEILFSRDSTLLIHETIPPSPQHVDASLCDDHRAIRARFSNGSASLLRIVLEIKASDGACDRNLHLLLEALIVSREARSLH